MRVNQNSLLSFIIPKAPKHHRRKLHSLSVQLLRPERDKFSCYSYGLELSLDERAHIMDVLAIGCIA